NESRKISATEIESYSNLLRSLKKDSVDLVRVIELQIKSLETQNKVIQSQSFEIIDTMSANEITEMIYDIYNGAYSFFPKYGTYNSIVTNRGLDIIKSERIKSNLIDLYDYWCFRYENVDNVLDIKYHNVLYPFLQEEIGFFVNSDFAYENIDVPRFEKGYYNLQLQCKNLNPLTNHSIRQLVNIQEKVNELILEISSQIE
ncbi:MAG: hypothetical protein KJN70_16030, partial [Eudoraea sp.]|nr:hypothetical protein [Eudoraea sp.]